MTAIIKNKFRIRNAKDFLENLDSTKHSVDRNHYLFIGKPTVWGDGSQNDELYPVTPSDTLEEDAQIWDEMLGLKKIIETHGSLVIPRSDWDATGNTIYAIFDDKDSNLYRQPSQERIESASITNNVAGNFYVLNSDYQIFVCIENGNNSVSTVKPVKPPSITDLVDYSDQDGYVWKYVTTIQQSDIVKFLTDSWMPIKTLLSDDGINDQWNIQQGAISGEALSVVVESGGSGYTKVHDGIISNPQNVGGKGTATLTSLVGGDAPSSIIDDYKDCQIHIVDGDGLGQIYTIESYDGSVITLTEEWEQDEEGIIVTNSSEYKILPALSITSNGTSSIKLRPILTDGIVTRVLIIDGGEGATHASAQVLDTAGGSGASIRVVLSPPKGLLNDPEKDLGAFFVMLNSKLQYTEGSGDFPISNDYRQIGIVRDVQEFSGALATAQTLIATKKLQLTNVVEGINGLFRSDEIITDGSVSAIVLDYDSTSQTITFIQNVSTGYGAFSTSATLSGADSSCEATISSVIDEEVKKHEGDILYLENRRAILRSEDQVEDIKVIIEF